MLQLQIALSATQWIYGSLTWMRRGHSLFAALRRDLRISSRLFLAQAPLLLMGLLVSPQVWAQSSLSDVVGIPPDAAIYPIPGLGFVNLVSGNLHIEFPVRSVKDRNGTPETSVVRH
jgi:hypothetical protein